MKVWWPIMTLIIGLQAIAVWRHRLGERNAWPSLSHMVWTFEARGPFAWFVVLVVWLWLGQHFLLRSTLPTDWGWR